MTTLASTIEILRALVGFDTTSRDSNLALIEWVESYLASHGIAAQKILNKEGTKASLFATIGQEKNGGEGGVVFSGHTDVVPVDGQDWHTPPFTLTTLEDKIYGRGTCDMKGFIACVLAMVPHWAQQKLKQPIHLALSYDEEIGCRQAAAIATHINAQGWKPRLVIVGEPTMMQPVAAHKGIYSFLTTVTGKEAHSSQTQIGVSSITYATKLITKLTTLEAECKQQQDKQFLPPYTTIQVGVIHGGTARNIIPHQCSFEWEIRPLPQDDPPAALACYQEFEKDLNKEMQSHDAACGVHTEPVTRVLSLKLEEDESLRHLILHLSESNALQAVSYGTEGGIMQSHGLPCFICGPGSIQQAHIPNEYVEVAQLERCLRFLQRID